MQKPKIYCFSAVRGGDGIAFAMAEDGLVLSSHWCKSEHHICADLGVAEGFRPDLHKERYTPHYPNGYEMEFVRYADIKEHIGLREALRLNDLLGEDEDE